MSFEDIKKGLPLIAWAGVTWLGCYAIVWLEKAECEQTATVCLRAAFKSWFEELIYLSWVHDYQTLIAGVLAVVAASAIFINSSHERKARAEDAEKTSRDRVRGICAAINVRLRATTLDTMTGTPAEIVDQLSEIKHDLAALAGYAPKVATRLQFHLGVAKNRVQKWNQLIDDLKKEQDEDERDAIRSVIKQTKASIQARTEFSRLHLTIEKVETDDIEGKIPLTRKNRNRMFWTDLEEMQRTDLLKYAEIVDEDGL